MSMFSPRSLDVDVVLDLMIHDIDVVLALTGLEPEEIRAAGIRILSDKVDIANVRLAFPGGCVANLTASRVSTEKIRKIRLFQPNQYISLDYQRQDAAAFTVLPDRQIGFDSFEVVKGEPLRLEVEAFLNAYEPVRTAGDRAGRERKRSLWRLQFLLRSKNTEPWWLTPQTETGQPRKHKFRLNLVVHPSRTQFPADHTGSRRRPPLGPDRGRIGLLHILLGLIVDLRLANIPVQRRVTDLRIRPSADALVTPLIAPPAALTQKEPNKKPLSAEFNVASIAPRPESPDMPSPGAAALPKKAPANKFVPPPQRGARLPQLRFPDAPSLDVRGERRAPATRRSGRRTYPATADPAARKTQNRVRSSWRHDGHTQPDRVDPAHSGATKLGG